MATLLYFRFWLKEIYGARFSKRRCMNWKLAIRESGDIGGPVLDVRATGYRWQARFDLFLRKIPPDDMNVICCVDMCRGPVWGQGMGKSTFCRYALREHAALLGTIHDHKVTSHLYEGQPIIMFDVERVKLKHIDYGLIEELKDGKICSSYYHGYDKTAISPTGTSHVILFCHWYPDFTQLNNDRWHLIDNFGDDQTIHDLFPKERFPGVADLVDPFA